VGPERTHGIAPAGPDLGGIVLDDSLGRPVRLGDIVDRPTIVNLVRYYGCPPCRLYLGSLEEHLDEIHRAGGGALGIGPAAPYQAVLLERSQISFPLLLDPERRVATALGLGRQSLLRFVFDVRGWWRWLRAMLGGARQGAITAGWQELPAVAVLDAGGSLRWLHRGRFVGDYPPLSTVLRHLGPAGTGHGTA